MLRLLMKLNQHEFDGRIKKCKSLSALDRTEVLAHCRQPTTNWLSAIHRKAEGNWGPLFFPQNGPASEVRCEVGVVTGAGPTDSIINLEKRVPEDKLAMKIIIAIQDVNRSFTLESKMAQYATILRSVKAARVSQAHYLLEPMSDEGTSVDDGDADSADLISYKIGYLTSVLSSLKPGSLILQRLNMQARGVTPDFIRDLIGELKGHAAAAVDEVEVARVAYWWDNQV